MFKSLVSNLHHTKCPLFLVVAIILGGEAFAQPQQKTKEALRFDPSVSQDKTRQYWTNERRRKAKPAPLPKIQKEGFEKLIKEKPLTPDQNPGKKSSHQRKALGTAERADVSQVPYSRGGKLFFTLDGEDLYCTAQFVGYFDVIMTAAHCLRSNVTGAWAQNIEFSLQYENANEPDIFSEFVCQTTWNAWVSPDDSRYRWDYGFLKTKREGSGHVGYDAEVPSFFESIGYPFNYDEGEYLQRVYGFRHRVFDGIVEMTGNPMLGGSSGGAWLLNTSNDNYALGVNSFGYDEQPNSMYGPDINADTIELMAWAHSGCPE